MNPTTATLDPRWRAHADPAWLERWTPRAIALDGGGTEAVSLGDGEPLLLVPPLPGFKEAYVAALPRLARRFRVTTWDLRAHRGPDAMARNVADLASVADAVGARRFVLAGHSLGGAIAQRFALAHPERVSALVLSSSFARVRTPAAGLAARWLEQPLVLLGLRTLPDPASLALAQWLARRRRWVFEPAALGAVAELVRFGVRTLAPAVALAEVRLALGHDARRDLPGLACPALLLVGERDTAFARAAFEELAALLPRAARVQIANAGHLHPLTRPDRFAEAIEGLAAGR